MSNEQAANREQASQTVHPAGSGRESANEARANEEATRSTGGGGSRGDGEGIRPAGLSGDRQPAAPGRAGEAAGVNPTGSVAEAMSGDAGKPNTESTAERMGGRGQSRDAGTLAEALASGRTEGTDDIGGAQQPGNVAEAMGGGSATESIAERMGGAGSENNAAGGETTGTPGRRRWQSFLFDRETSQNPTAGRGHAKGQNEPAPRDAIKALIAEPFRMMQELVRSLPSGAGDLDRWFGDFRPARLQPQIDVVDTGETLTVAAELPGVAKEDLEVLVEGEALVLRGEKRQEYEGREEGCYHIERAFGRFERRIPLPDNVDPGRAQAEFENAVLRVRIPKTRQQHRARRIDIG